MALAFKEIQNGRQFAGISSNLEAGRLFLVGQGTSVPRVPVIRRESRGVRDHGRQPAFRADFHHRVRAAASAFQQKVFHAAPPYFLDISLLKLNVPCLPTASFTFSTTASITLSACL